jgi:hypothetical protein
MRPRGRSAAHRFVNFLSGGSALTRATVVCVSSRFLMITSSSADTAIAMVGCSCCVSKQLLPSGSAVRLRHRRARLSPAFLGVRHGRGEEARQKESPQALSARVNPWLNVREGRQPLLLARSAAARSLRAPLTRRSAKAAGPARWAC